jgi:hypothetical protein
MNVKRFHMFALYTWRNLWNRLVNGNQECSRIVTDLQQYTQKTHYTPTCFGPRWPIIMEYLYRCIKQLTNFGLIVYVEELLVIFHAVKSYTVDKSSEWMNQGCSRWCSGVRGTGPVNTPAPSTRFLIIKGDRACVYVSNNVVAFPEKTCEHSHWLRERLYWALLKLIAHVTIKKFCAKGVTVKVKVFLWTS